MCITASVGKGGRNDATDVRCVQIVLNLYRAQSGLDAPMAVDGLCGAGTVRALTAYQRALGREDTGVVAPGDAVLTAMAAALPAAIAMAPLWGAMCGASAAAIGRYWTPLAERMDANGIDTPLRRAHFLAQVGHECGDLRYPEELADGTAYEGRKDLGNVEPGDGPRFKGRGLIQLTGRANYTKYGEARGRDVVTGDNPKLVASDPQLAVDVACWFWTTRGLNQWADKDDVNEITRRVNGGFNGLADREARLARAKWFMRA
ncbi:MAG: hypothetical protein M0006_07625 [Magnetospirillum sp.]|nr:hypothetical protein [Magnetospirillum sp.]